MPKILPRKLYAEPTGKLARKLLGCRLVRERHGIRLAGRIVETEAYIGEKDLACHAHVGKTPRTRIMYGPPGVCYVYFTYGMHWLLNVVAEEEGFPAAVLIRALEPLEGLDVMGRLRPGKTALEFCRGPAKLTRALDIRGEHNGADLCRPGASIWIEPAAVGPLRIERTPRIGISRTPEPWRSKPWRFTIKGNHFLSR
jgi:DNA-3-methyladenine glycosylase